jgi:phospholipid/cholesterol/gamma-HCH transport system substrate-binding protein
MNAIRGIARRRLHARSTTLGAALLVVIVAVGYGLFNKDEILTRLRSGETVEMTFASGVPLVPYESKVKIAYIPVGTVTGVRRVAGDQCLVTVKVNHGTRAKLGSDPTATVRPTTLLGGNYFVDLEPGGDHVTLTGAIPVTRTALPVELDKVAAALQPNAVKGLQGGVADLSATVRAGAGSALDTLAKDAPGVLQPASRVLSAAQGENPATDLTRLVGGLESTARVLDAKQGQLDDIIANLHVTTSTFATHSKDIAASLAELPATLQSTDAGLQQLNVSLTKLGETATVLKPAASALDVTLLHANPLLLAARPVVTQLDTLLTSAQPLVTQLVPTAQTYTQVLDAVQGPVLDRLNGSLENWLLSPYHGTGPYAGTGSNKPFYEEIAYTAADIDRASEMRDRNGSAVGLEAGAGAGSLDGLLPISVEQMFEILTDKFHLSAGLGGK